MFLISGVRGLTLAPKPGRSGKIGPTRPTEDLVGLLSEEGVAWGLGGGVWAWHCLVAKETNRAWGGGARSRKGNALRPGCPLSAESCSSTAATAGAECLGNTFMGSEAQRGG